MLGKLWKNIFVHFQVLNVFGHLKFVVVSNYTKTSGKMIIFIVGVRRLDNNLSVTIFSENPD